MKNLVKLPFLINIILLLCLVGCNQDSVSTTETVSEDVKEVEIYIRNHKFEPNEIIVPQNTKIRLTVHNTDETIEEFESIDLRREKIVPAKDKINITIAPLKAGTYKFFGDFNAETAKGCLIVE